jgi:hypothetical protein
MSEARVADELRGSYAENLLLYINDQGCHVARDLLVEFIGDAWAASAAVQELVNINLAEVSSMSADVKLPRLGVALQTGSGSRCVRERGGPMRYSGQP